MSDTLHAGLVLAIDAAGGQSALAKLVGKRQSNVWRWLKSGRIPAEMAIPIETALSRKVTRHDMRPDIFGPRPLRRKRAA